MIQQIESKIMYHQHLTVCGFAYNEHLNAHERKH